MFYIKVRIVNKIIKRIINVSHNPVIQDIQTYLSEVLVFFFLFLQNTALLHNKISFSPGIQTPITCCCTDTVSQSCQNYKT